MRFYFLHNQAGEVCSYGTGPSISNKFLQTQVDVNDADLKLLRLNYQALIQRGVLVLKKTQRIFDDEKKTSEDKARTDLQQKILNKTAILADVLNYFQTL
jgi:hypothetical protein